MKPRHEKDLRSIVRWAAQELRDYQGDDWKDPCSCSDNGFPPCTDLNPECWTRRLHVMALELEASSSPPLVTLHPNRLGNPAEQIYVKRWIAENERKSWLNSGFTLAEHLLCPSDVRYPEPVTDHDMQVLTTFVQWLGTNCGHCFIMRAEGEIKKTQAQRSDFDRKYRPTTLADHSPMPGHPHRDIPTAIADQFVPPVDMSHASLRGEIVKAMKWAAENPRQVEAFEHPTAEHMALFLHVNGWKHGTFGREGNEHSTWSRPDGSGWLGTSEAFEEATTGKRKIPLSRYRA